MQTTSVRCTPASVTQTLNKLQITRKKAKFAAHYLPQLCTFMLVMLLIFGPTKSPPIYPHLHTTEEFSRDYGANLS